jgi:proteasome lid subunit RPN8/RPN11
MHPTPEPASSPRFQKGSTLGEIHADALPILIREPILEEILEYSEEDTSRELGGFLVGRYDTEAHPRVEIRHFLPAASAASRAASLTFTHETWAQLTREVESQYPDEVVVGWHHTHPNFGIFLSAYDLFIHRHFFPDPWQIAMVVDPRRQELGFFQWRQGEVVDCGFVCVAE